MSPLPSRPIVYSDDNACWADWFLCLGSAAVSDGGEVLYIQTNEMNREWAAVSEKRDIILFYPWVMWTTCSCFLRFHIYTLLPFKSSMSSLPPSTTNRTQSFRLRLSFTISIQLRREDVNKRSEKFLSVCYEIWIILKYQFIKTIFLET